MGERERERSMNENRIGIECIVIVDYLERSDRKIHVTSNERKVFLLFSRRVPFRFVSLSPSSAAPQPFGYRKIEFSTPQARKSLAAWRK